MHSLRWCEQTTAVADDGVLPSLTLPALFPQQITVADASGVVWFCGASIAIGYTTVMRSTTAILSHRPPPPPQLRKYAEESGSRDNSNPAVSRGKKYQTPQ
jgi:hypothetical protein